MSSTVHSTYTIWCDGPDCRQRRTSVQSRAVARRMAAREGWTVNVDKLSRSGGKDYCPDHKPEEG
jgi:hypothetical protein